jgi:hypothetical protein
MLTGISQCLHSRQETHVRGDVVLLSNGLLVVGIDLCEGDGILARVFGREAFVYGSYRLARTAPVCVDLGMLVCVPEMCLVVGEGDVYRIQSTTTPLEEDSKDLSWSGDSISTSLDMFGIVVVSVELLLLWL